MIKKEFIARQSEWQSKGKIFTTENEERSTLEDQELD